MCPAVAADAPLSIGTALISTVLSLDELLSKTRTSCVPTFCNQSALCFLVLYFLVRYKLLNGSRTAPNDLDKT
jgi:hypothetical protein